MDGTPATGIVGFLQAGIISTVCFLAAPLGEWVAWKRPRLEFGAAMGHGISTVGGA